MPDNDAREINPIQWFDDRDAVTATKDFRPRPEAVTEAEEPTIADPDVPPHKRPAKD